MFSSIVVGILGFYYCSLETNASHLGPPHLYGPDIALDKDIVEFGCKVIHLTTAEPILLQLFKQGDRSKVLAFHTSLDGSPAAFPMVVRYTTHEGYLECVASVQNNSLIRPTVSRPHYLKVVEPVKGATLAVQSGAVEFFEGKILVLRCNVTSGNHISYSWLLDDQPLPASAFHHAHQELFISRTRPEHSGNYACVATNQLNDTKVYTAASPEVLITIKEFVSNPDISYAINKENSQNYSAWVTCKSSRGTLPITFSLYNRATLVVNEKTVEKHYATFTIPLVLNHHLGWLQCQAENGDRTAYSEWMALQVVSVGGPVTLRYECITGEDFSVTNVRFYCKAAKGTHPRFQWFLNGTLLEQDTWPFNVLFHQPAEQSVLLLPVDRRSTGTYHCEVSDLFDNTTVIQSEKMYLHKEVVNRLSSVVVAVVFSCFGLVLTCVFTCCCAGVIFIFFYLFYISLLLFLRWNQRKMETMVLAYEDDLDLEEYRENADILTAAGINDFDLGSMASTDEWPETVGIKELNTEC
ncbi:unnamed protein product [Lota lota]